MLDMNAVNYKVLRAATPDALELLVVEALADGWVLQGGVSFGAANFVQAVIWLKSN